MHRYTEDPSYAAEDHKRDAESATPAGVVQHYGSSDPIKFLATLVKQTAAAAASNRCNGTASPLSCGGDSRNATTDAAYPDGEDDDFFEYLGNRAVEEALGIVVPILFGAIAVIGFFGNALVVLVVLCNPQMRSTTNILIINLAMADLAIARFPRRKIVIHLMMERCTMVQEKCIVTLSERKLLSSKKMVRKPSTTILNASK